MHFQICPQIAYIRRFEIKSVHHHHRHQPDFKLHSFIWLFSTFSIFKSNHQIVYIRGFEIITTPISNWFEAFDSVSKKLITALLIISTPMHFEQPQPVSHAHHRSCHPPDFDNFAQMISLICSRWNYATKKERASIWWKVTHRREDGEKYIIKQQPTFSTAFLLTLVTIERIEYILDSFLIQTFKSIYPEWLLSGWIQTWNSMCNGQKNLCWKHRTYELVLIATEPKGRSPEKFTGYF